METIDGVLETQVNQRAPILKQALTSPCYNEGEGRENGKNPLSFQSKQKPVKYISQHPHNEAAAATTTMKPQSLIPINGSPALILFFNVFEKSEKETEVEASCKYLK